MEADYQALGLGNQFGDFEGEIQAKYAGLKDGSKTVDLSLIHISINVQRPFRIKISSSAMRILYIAAVLLWKQNGDRRAAILKTGYVDSVFRAIQVVQHFVHCI